MAILRRPKYEETLSPDACDSGGESTAAGGDLKWSPRS